MVGYSKGGAEAAANAVATGKDAILFNPASAAFGHYKLDETKYEGNMVSYIIDGEILNSIFKDLDRTPGEKIFLRTKNENYESIKKLLAHINPSFALGIGFGTSVSSIFKHGLSNFDFENNNK